MSELLSRLEDMVRTAPAEEIRSFLSAEIPEASLDVHTAPQTEGAVPDERDVVN